MSLVSVSDQSQHAQFAETAEGAQVDLPQFPPLRWIMVGYFFWVGIFLGALIMHSATGL